MIAKRGDCGADYAPNESSAIWHFEHDDTFKIVNECFFMSVKCRIFD